MHSEAARGRCTAHLPGDPTLNHASWSGVSTTYTRAHSMLPYLEGDTRPAGVFLGLDPGTPRFSGRATPDKEIRNARRPPSLEGSRGRRQGQGLGSPQTLCAEVQSLLSFHPKE